MTKRQISTAALLLSLSLSIAQPRAAAQQAYPPDAARSAKIHPATIMKDKKARKWADSVLATLSLRQKIGQLVTVFTFSELTPKTLNPLRELVLSYGIGGVIISKGTVADASAICDSIRSWAQTPPLISADFENGLAMRLEGATEFPSAMALGATRESALAAGMGKAVAAEMRALGVQQNYAPVCDVNNNPGNPVINVRSFGENPALVGALASAYMRGMQEGGVIATAKHFPGHGDTDVDSHTNLPAIHKFRSALDTLELAPFKRLVKDGVLAVMSAHIAVSALTGDSSMPSTFSRAAIDTLLRRRMGFSGLVVSDALNMGAIANTYGSAEAARRALNAGIDVLLMPKDPKEAVDSLAAFAERGELSLDRIDASARAILQYKYWAMKYGSPARLSATASSRNRELAVEIARKAVTLVKNNGILPLRTGAAPATDLVLLLNGNGDSEGRALYNQLRARIPLRNVFFVQRSSQVSEFDTILASAKTARRIVAASFAGIRTTGDPAGISAVQKQLLNSLGSKKTPVVFAAMQSPYVLASFPNAGAMLCSYDKSAPSIQAMAEALCGELVPSGKLPVSIPGIAAYGAGLSYPKQQDTSAARIMPAQQPAANAPQPAAPAKDSANSFAEVDAMIEAKIRERAFPGAQLIVGSRMGILYRKNYGRLTYDAGSPSVTDSTMYDIASLSKVVSTTTAAMKLYEEGRIKLSDPVVQYVPEFGIGVKRSVTLRHLLTHTSGLAPFKLYYQTMKTGEEVIAAICAMDLDNLPGEGMKYSDLGYIMLGKCIETAARTPLNRYADSAIFSPLGMRNTMYAPPAAIRNQCAPTEKDTYWRNRLVQGTVHDENAALLDGVAGHAGVFSTAADLSNFVRMLMNGGTHNGRRILKAATIEEFTKPVRGAAGRTLGWDTKSDSGSSAGSRYSAASFGHTGFTGTSIWIDPKDDVFVIFLTNRVYPSRENKALPRFRAPLHDAIRKAVGR